MMLSRIRVVCGPWVCCFVMAAAAAGEPCLVETGRLAAQPVEWLSLDGSRLLYGAGTELSVAEAGPVPVRRATTGLPVAAGSAVLVGDRVFWSDAVGNLGRLQLDSGESIRSVSPWRGQPVGRVLLGRMDDYVLAAEDGFGIHVLRIPVHHGPHAEHRPSSDLQRVGGLSLPAEFTAVASSVRQVYLGLADGRIVVVDASNPHAPFLRQEHPTGLAIRALAADGTTVYALTDDRLQILDFSDGSGAVRCEHAVSGGRAVEVAGRLIQVGGPELGLLTLRNQQATAATVNVTVGDSFFQPSIVSVNRGDTVVWSKQTAGFHNVESCDGEGDPAACGGTFAANNFISGLPTFSTFTFSHTFQFLGVSRYFCQTHTDFGMNGRVNTVNPPDPTPPGVPDGMTGSPMTVGKNDVAGNQLTVFWDTATCTNAVDHHILFGGGSQLPATPGGIYDLLGGACDLGTTSPFVWDSPSTALDPTGLIWWVMVADDNVDTEGSWGQDGLNNERSGSGAAGSSGQCGMTTKDLTNTCGQ